jgi:hypothetical protein
VTAQVGRALHSRSRTRKRRVQAKEHKELKELKEKPQNPVFQF